MEWFFLRVLSFLSQNRPISLEFIEEARVCAASLHKVFEHELLFSIDFDLELLD